MGLIKAALGSVSSVLGDQWREYFYCDSMEADVLMRKGIKRTGKRSSNTKAYMFVYRTSEHCPEKPVILYQYAMTRSRSNVQDISTFIPFSSTGSCKKTLRYLYG